MPDLRTRYLAVQQCIQAAALESGRAATPPLLLAVSKTHPAAAIRALYALGQRDFGENYVQELQAKAAELSDLPALRWHYIGHLQSNKLASIARLAHSVHALCDRRHAKLLAAALPAGKRLEVYIAVKGGDSAQKSGIAPAAALALAAEIGSTHPELQVMGLMCVPSADIQDPETGSLVLPALYAELGRLATQLPGGGLSLGMSGDLRLAIKAGASVVRIGTAIFGPRGIDRT